MISATGVLPSVPAFPTAFAYQTDFLLRAEVQASADLSHNPDTATPCSYHAESVWPVPLSLATTHGIAVAFSSCGY